VAALLGATSMQALGQAKRKGQSRSARVSRAVRAGLTPTTALRAYYQAMMNKDTTTARKYLSEGTARMLEEDARSEGKSFEEAMIDREQRKPTVMPKFTGERIRGVTATVYVRTQGMTFPISMVKEAGEWKLALDKMRDKMIEEGKLRTPQAPAEGDYSEDEKHRLFQTVGITRDNDLIIEVAQKIGIVDSQGSQKPNFDAFVQAHYVWATKNNEFVLEHMSEDTARAYVMAHK